MGQGGGEEGRSIKWIVVLTTGGTIATRAVGGGATPHPSGADLPPFPPEAGLHRGPPHAFRRRGGLVGAAGGISAAPGLPPRASASSSARRMLASLTGRGR